NFHFQPYELLWKHSDHEDEPDICIHGELYSSAAFLKAHKALLDSPPNPGCIAPRVIIALMFWSDETVLTSFGKTKLWPCYMYFGNESKYQQMKPSCNLANHIAYFEVLPDSFREFVVNYTGGKGPNEHLMKHCHRELFHAQWEILLDDEFLEAYENSALFACSNGVIRQFYPRVFTY
ncbi:hypothetical protein L208DRAFT_1052945, partial [Tricholoma matsutake]